MIKKYVYGTPFPTDAVVLDVQPSTDALPFFETDQQGTFTYSLSENDIVYGLGEQIRGINKRGWQYVSWNYDNPNHHEDARSLYGAHNFINSLPNSSWSSTCSAMASSGKSNASGLNIISSFKAAFKNSL